MGGAGLLLATRVGERVTPHVSRRPLGVDVFLLVS